MSKCGPISTSRTPLVGVLIAPLILLACVVWSHWSTLGELRAFWAANEDYSVGQLVPLVALYLVWRERRVLLAERARPSVWGVAVLLAAEGLRQAAMYYGLASGERYALVLTITGVVLLAAGWRVLRRVGWILAFLLLMVPLPGRIHEAIALPLQRLATTAAVFALELLGFFVIREGHILRLNPQTSVGVAEACSGLRMLTAFVVVAATLAFLISRPSWHKAVLLLASVPIAVLSNTVRSVLTAAVVYYTQNSTLSSTFHDGAGLAMMPLGLLLSLGLLNLLRRLSADEGAVSAVPAHVRHGPGGAKHAACGTRRARRVATAAVPRILQGRGRV